MLLIAVESISGNEVVKNVIQSYLAFEPDYTHAYYMYISCKPIHGHTCIHVHKWLVEFETKLYKNIHILFAYENKTWQEKKSALQCEPNHYYYNVPISK